MKFAEALDQVQTRVVGRDGLETQHFLSSDLEPRWKDAVVFFGCKASPGFHYPVVNGGSCSERLGYSYFLLNGEPVGATTRVFQPSNSSRYYMVIQI